jgi:hypothetical protein
MAPLRKQSSGTRQRPGCNSQELKPPQESGINFTGTTAKALIETPTIQCSAGDLTNRLYYRKLRQYKAVPALPTAGIYQSA